MNALAGKVKDHLPKSLKAVSTALVVYQKVEA
jgi:hypothetical protein